MDNPNLHGIPDYLKVPEPWHFKVRPDLVEELCLAEAMWDNLPRSVASYRMWRKMGGYHAWYEPFEAMAEHYRKGYRSTHRWAFGMIVFPEEKRARAVAIDARGWWTESPLEGLCTFVFRRAMEFTITRGYSPPEARSLLLPKVRSETNTRDNTIHPLCLVGYERGSGLCQIIQPSLNDGLRRFLKSSADAVPLKFPPRNSTKDSNR